MALESGAKWLAAALQERGVRHVFGMPGTQNALLFSALRRTNIRTISSTSELTAAFMANGYFRAGGGTGVLATIPGPGFCFAIPGLAEASLDSCALVHLTEISASRAGRRFDLQVIPQREMIRPLVKDVIDVDRPENLPPAIDAAFDTATSGGPGPVVVEIAGSVLRRNAEWAAPRAPLAGAPIHVDTGIVVEIAARVSSAGRVVVFAGQGAAGAADLVADLVRRRPAVVVTTLSGRGLLPESHPWSLGWDVFAGHTRVLNEVLEAADLVLVLGCRTSHNATAGFSVIFPGDRTVHVDADPTVPGSNFAPRWGVASDARVFLSALLDAMGPGSFRSEWTESDVAGFRRSLRQEVPVAPPEPQFPGVPGGTAAEFFAAVRDAVPPETIVVTDTGNHQIMTRRHWRVESPRGFIAPSDFQSMGFGLPAAIGARLAAPDRPVMAIVGDGSMVLVGLELATAVRENLDLTVVVFNDGHLGQIRLQQIASGEGEAATTLAPLNFAALALAVGAHYECIQDDVAGPFRRALSRAGVTLIEVPLLDSSQIRKARATAAAKAVVRRALGPRLVRAVKRILRRP